VWLTFSEISVDCHLVWLFEAYDKVVHHAEGVVEESCSPHGGQEEGAVTP
jgi:hypothetical protein